MSEQDQHQAQNPLIAALSGEATAGHNPYSSINYTPDTSAGTETSHSQISDVSQQATPSAAYDPSQVHGGNWSGLDFEKLTTRVSSDGSERPAGEPVAVRPRSSAENYLAAAVSRQVTPETAPQTSSGASESVHYDVERVMTSRLSEAAQELRDAAYKAPTAIETARHTPSITAGVKSLIAPARTTLATIVERVSASDAAAINQTAEEIGSLRTLGGEYNAMYGDLDRHQEEVSFQAQDFQRGINEGSQLVDLATTELSIIARGLPEEGPDADYLKNQISTTKATHVAIDAQRARVGDVVQHVEGALEAAGLEAPDDVNQKMILLSRSLVEYDGTPDSHSQLAAAYKEVATFVQELETRIIHVETTDETAAKVLEHASGTLQEMVDHQPFPKKDAN